MPVIRGYSFGTNEFVTSDTLHRLVDSAAITDLTPDEFTGEIHGLSTATPASIRAGDILFLHETSVSLVRPTGITPWSNPNYLVSYNGQWVSLFGADHLESGRFYNESGATIDQGEHCQFASTSGSGAATLTLGADSIASGKAYTVGGQQGATSVVGAITKIRMIGFGLFSGSSRTAGADWLDTLNHITADHVWNRSTVSDNSGHNAMRLNTTADGDSDVGRLQPCFHLGALNFRE